MKKVLSVLLAAVMVFTLLVACANNTPATTNGNNSQNSTEKTTEPANSGEKPELRIAIWGDEARAAAYEETLAPFCEANNCSVKIELVPIGDYFDKLASQLGAGTAPDIFWLGDAKEATFINGGWCADLKDTLSEDADYHLEDFYESAIYSTDYNEDGSIYGVPFSFGARVIFYNKTLLKADGLETPDECIANGTWTYEKMFEIAQAVSKADSTKVGVKLWCVGQEKNGIQAFADILPAYGANIFNADSSEFTLDTPEGIAVTKMVYDAIYTNGGHAKPDDTTAFASGNVAMARECYSYMKTMANSEADFEWDVAPMPYGSKGKDAPLYTGYAYWCADATGKNVELAKQLIKFVTNPENQMAWCSTFMCPRDSVMTSDKILNLGEGYPTAEKIKAAFVDPVNEQGLYTYRGTPDFTLLQNTVQQGYEMIWAGQYSIENGIAEMKQAVAPYLNEPKG